MIKLGRIWAEEDSGAGLRAKEENGGKLKASRRRLRALPSGNSVAVWTVHAEAR